MTFPLEPRLALSYLFASLILTLTPGPDTLFVIATGFQHRARGALASALGISTGAVIHGLAVALGLSALVAASPFAFAVIRTVGAAYLAWLGVKALRAALRDPKRSAQPSAAPRASFVLIFRRGLLNNLANPKVPLFYLAILPQFVDAGRGHVGLQMFLLSLIGTVVATPYLVGVGTLSGRLRAKAVAGSLGRWLEGVAGLLFIGLALRMALTGRPER